MRKWELGMGSLEGGRRNAEGGVWKWEFGSGTAGKKKVRRWEGEKKGLSAWGRAGKAEGERLGSCEVEKLKVRSWEAEKVRSDRVRNQ